eukprot:CFRG6118T1
MVDIPPVKSAYKNVSPAQRSTTTSKNRTSDPFKGRMYHLLLDGLRDDIYATLERNVQVLGARVTDSTQHDFKDVTHIVTNHNTRKEKAQVPSVKSRGNLILQKIREEATYKVTSTLDRARELGIHISSLSAFTKEMAGHRKLLEHKLAKVSNKREGPNITRGPGFVSLPSNVYGIKIEDKRGQLRPRVYQWESCPTMFIPGKGLVENPNVRGTNEKKLSQKAARVAAFQYCETCQKCFTDLNEHMLDPQHMQYAENGDNFTDFREFVKSLEAETFSRLKREKEAVEEIANRDKAISEALRLKIEKEEQLKKEKDDWTKQETLRIRREEREAMEKEKVLQDAKRAEANRIQQEQHIIEEAAKREAERIEREQNMLKEQELREHKQRLEDMQREAELKLRVEKARRDQEEREAQMKMLLELETARVRQEERERLEAARKIYEASEVKKRQLLLEEARKEERDRLEEQWRVQEAAELKNREQLLEAARKEGRIRLQREIEEKEMLVSKQRVRERLAEEEAMNKLRMEQAAIEKKKNDELLEAARKEKEEKERLQSELLKIQRDANHKRESERSETLKALVKARHEQEAIDQKKIEEWEQKLERARFEMEVRVQEEKEAAQRIIQERDEQMAKDRLEWIRLQREVIRQEEVRRLAEETVSASVADGMASGGEEENMLGHTWHEIADGRVHAVKSRKKLITNQPLENKKPLEKANREALLLTRVHAEKRKKETLLREREELEWKEMSQRATTESSTSVDTEDQSGDGEAKCKRRTKRTMSEDEGERHAKRLRKKERKLSRRARHSTGNENTAHYPQEPRQGSSRTLDDSLQNNSHTYSLQQKSRETDVDVLSTDDRPKVTTTVVKKSVPPPIMLRIGLSSVASVTKRAVDIQNLDSNEKSYHNKSLFFNLPDREPLKERTTTNVDQNIRPDVQYKAKRGRRRTPNSSYTDEAKPCLRKGILPQEFGLMGQDNSEEYNAPWSVRPPVETEQKPTPTGDYLQCNNATYHTPATLTPNRLHGQLHHTQTAKVEQESEYVYQIVVKALTKRGIQDGKRIEVKFQYRSLDGAGTVDRWCLGTLSSVNTKRLVCKRLPMDVKFPDEPKAMRAHFEAGGKMIMLKMERTWRTVDPISRDVFSVEPATPVKVNSRLDNESLLVTPTAGDSFPHGTRSSTRTKRIRYTTPTPTRVMFKHIEQQTEQQDGENSISPLSANNARLRVHERKQDRRDAPTVQLTSSIWSEEAESFSACVSEIITRECKRNGDGNDDDIILRNTFKDLTDLLKGQYKLS